MENAGNVTDKNLRAWLGDSAAARGIDNGLTFVTTESSAERRQAGILAAALPIYGSFARACSGAVSRPQLKDARELARNKRALIQQGTDVAMQKQVEKLASLEEHDVAGLAQAGLIGILQTGSSIPVGSNV